MKRIEVVAAVIRRGNEIFATQRGYGDFKDWWEFPGGKMEAGESPEEALRREIREELDAEIRVERFLKTVEWDYPAFHLTLHCYLCRLASASLHLNEHEASRWLDAESLGSVRWLPADVSLLPILKDELETKENQKNMTLEQQIQEDIKAAMKAKDTVAMNATRAVKGEILLFKTSEGGSKEVTDGDILKMVRKLVKQRKEAAEQYVAAGRPELADNELAEAAVMEKYLPAQLSEAEVEAKVKEIIARAGATSIKEMGKVMGVANKELAGLADGRTISTFVKQLLA